MANIARRKLAAMVSTVDEAVRNVTYALRKYGYYRNSVIVYSTDNGAQPFTGGSNWPLRGRKVERGPRTPKKYQIKPLFSSGCYSKHFGVLEQVGWDECFFISLEI